MGKLLSILQKAGLEEPNSWDSIITDANDSATTYVLNALLARGYTIAQVQQWDALKPFVVDIAEFWALVKGGCTKAYDPTFIQLLDRRQELLTVDIVINGLLVVPGDVRIKSGMLAHDTDVLTGDVRPRATAPLGRLGPWGRRHLEPWELD
jgi:hypothetical protein